MNLLVCASLLISLLNIPKVLQDKRDFVHLHMLEGTWIRPGASGNLYEKWRKTGDDNMEGLVFTISNGDTSISERPPHSILPDFCTERNLCI
jgi:hypothetical protein